MAAFVGKKFRVSTIGGDTFEGILHSVDVNNKKISLVKVSIVPSGKKLTGLLHFYGQEIATLDDVLDEPESKADTKSNIQCDSNKSEGDLSDSADEDVLDCSTPDGYLYIHHRGSKFRQALDYIKTQQLIGLATEAETLGRRSKVSLLQVSTSDHVFIFDVLSLGPPLFTEGLADILESSTVVKVMHDSRWASDQLYHQYSVKLANVYDTQAADVLVRMRHQNGELPHKLSSLPQCLIEYLNLPIQEVYPQWVHDQARESEPDQSWLERPLSSNLLCLAASKVRHLPALRMVTLHHLLAEFTASVDVYLGCIRDMPDMNRNKANVSPSVVPRQLERLVYGHLPSTTSPIENYNTTAVGYDLLKKANPHPEAEKAKSPSTHLRTQDATVVKTPSNESVQGVVIPASQHTRSIEESFCVPKMAVSQDTSKPSPERLTNGFAPSDGNEKYRDHCRVTSKGKAKTNSTFFFSPSSDGKSVVKISRTDTCHETAKDEKGFWEPPNQETMFLPSYGQTSTGNVQASSMGVKETMPASDTNGISLDNSQSGKSKMAPEGKEQNGVEEEDDYSDDDDDDDSDDYDEDNSEGLNDSRFENAVVNTKQEPVGRVEKDYFESSSNQAQHVKALLSMSPRRHEISPHPSTARGNTNRVLSKGYLGSREKIPTTDGRCGASRLYSSVLRDAGLIKANAKPREKFNINSPAQFPDLDHKLEESSKRRSGDKHRLSTKQDHTQDRVGQSPFHASNSPFVSLQLPQERMPSPTVGFGRARVLAQSDNILRNIRRPIELHSRATRIKQYDFPSKEEMNKIPRNIPQRASSHYLVSKMLESDNS